MVPPRKKSPVPSDRRKSARAPPVALTLASVRSGAPETTGTAPWPLSTLTVPAASSMRACSVPAFCAG